LRNKFVSTQRGSREWFDKLEKQIDSSDNGRRYRVLRTKSIDIQYQSPRPLYEWKSEDLLRLAMNGLKRTWPSIELPSLVLLELEKRHRTSDYRSVMDFFKSKKILPITWLDSLNSLLRKEIHNSKEKKGAIDSKSNSIYTVLIDSRKSFQNYSLYIGSTSEKNFESHKDHQEKAVYQHFEGTESNLDCKLFGIEALWSTSSMFLNSDLTKKQLLIRKSKIHTLAKTKVPLVLGERPFLDFIKLDKNFNSLLQKEK